MKALIEDRVLRAIVEHQAATGFVPLQKEIAASVGVCRAIVIRGLTKLEKQGRIRRSRRQILVLDASLPAVAE